MVWLEGVMETPVEVAVMRQLVERGWSRRRISTELGISRHTVSHHNYCLRSPSSEREVIQKTGKSCPLD
jgi:hypothetical protein